MQRVAWLLPLLIVAAGCSSEDELIDVRGRVTFLGKPWTADVIFQPVDNLGVEVGRPSLGYCDSDGDFRLRYTRDQNGAKPGIHRVTINIWKETPEKAGNFRSATTPIRVVKVTRYVAADRREFHFAIMP